MSGYDAVKWQVHRSVLDKLGDVIALADERYNGEGGVTAKWVSTVTDFALLLHRSVRQKGVLGFMLPRSTPEFLAGLQLLSADERNSFKHAMGALRYINQLVGAVMTPHFDFIQGALEGVPVTPMYRPMFIPFMPFAAPVAVAMPMMAPPLLQDDSYEVPSLLIPAMQFDYTWKGKDARSLHARIDRGEELVSMAPHLVFREYEAAKPIVRPETPVSPESTGMSGKFFSS